MHATSLPRLCVDLFGENLGVAVEFGRLLGSVGWQRRSLSQKPGGWKTRRHCGSRRLGASATER